MRRAAAAFLVLACGLAAAITADAGAATPQTRSKPKDLWATINLCDTEAHPDSMGVRASMPGDAQHTRMYMRFTAQYYNARKQQWITVAGSGVSKWYFAGSGLLARQQRGYTFSFEPPQDGSTYTSTMRGVVDFKWTKHGRIVRTMQQKTKGGHPNTLGADPKDYSAALCELTVGPVGSGG